jgi:hypothetical protein
LKLTRRDAAVEELPFFVVLLSPADDELALFDRNVELIAREACDGQSDAQTFRVPVVTGNPFDVVGRIAIRCLGDTIERTLDLVKAQQEGT